MRDPDETNGMFKFVMHAMSNERGTLDSRAKTLAQVLSDFRSRDPRYFDRFIKPDVDEAIDAYDMPRMARAVLHCFWHALTEMAVVQGVNLSQLEAWKRDVVATLPLDLFCRRWHEAHGSATDRARYIAEMEGGDVKYHLQRFRRNRARVRSWRRS